MKTQQIFGRGLAPIDHAGVSTVHYSNNAIVCYTLYTYVCIHIYIYIYICIYIYIFTYICT